MTRMHHITKLIKNVQFVLSKWKKQILENIKTDRFGGNGNAKIVNIEKQKNQIPIELKIRYGRYAKQAYVCLNRKGKTMQESWDELRKPDGKQLNLNL